MFAGIMNVFAGRRDAKQSTRDAIVALRQQLLMMEKKEEYLGKKVDEELTKAKQNAVNNKPAAKSALMRKKMYEDQLDHLNGARLQIETQIMTLESANFNMENMAAIKLASGALKDIHGKLTIDKVDQTMAEVQEQTQLANEVSEAISHNTMGIEFDEEELGKELAELEQEDLNDKLMADSVPIHQPGPSKAIDRTPVAVEDDEEAQLKELQAALAM